MPFDTKKECIDCVMNVNGKTGMRSQWKKTKRRMDLWGLPRGDSYLVMPPPMPQNPSLQQEQQQLGTSNGGGVNKRTLEEAHASWVGISPSELPIVSPDLVSV
jgi:hypothetical protein